MSLRYIRQVTIKIITSVNFSFFFIKKKFRLGGSLPMQFPVHHSAHGRRRRLVCYETSDSEDDDYGHRRRHRRHSHHDYPHQPNNQGPPHIHNLLNQRRNSNSFQGNLPHSNSTPNMNSLWQTMLNNASPQGQGQGQSSSVNSAWQSMLNAAGSSPPPPVEPANPSANFLSNMFNKMRQSPGAVLQPPPPQSAQPNSEAVNNFYAVRNLNFPPGGNQPAPPPMNPEAVGNFFAARNFASGIPPPNPSVGNVWNRVEGAVQNAPPPPGPPASALAWNQMRQYSPPPPFSQPGSRGPPVATQAPTSFASKNSSYQMRKDKFYIVIINLFPSTMTNFYHYLNTNCSTSQFNTTKNQLIKMKIFQIVFVFLFVFNEIFADYSCRYEHPTHGIINLSSIGLRTGQPVFKDFTPRTASNYVYSFNPCYSFSELSCDDVGVFSNDRQYSFTLAKQSSSFWNFNTSMTYPTLFYTYQMKTVAISMVCSPDQNHDLAVLGETRLNYFQMFLISPCACWNGCEKPVTSSTTEKTISTTPSSSSNACVYQDSQLGTIDLSSIGNLNGTAVFHDVSAIQSNDFLWSYNPCVPFTEDSCQRVAGCQKSKISGTSYVIGLQERAQWLNMNGTSSPPPSIVYSTLKNDRQLTVQLICDWTASDHRLQVFGEISTGKYLMMLTSRCACWNGCFSETTTRSTRHHFKWPIWMTIACSAAAVFLCLCTLVTCLLCTKPRRKYQPIIINEGTPMMKGASYFHSSTKQ
uniref:MRH domain-containing protein n=1 Tax=Philodina roseola TaxID=96448 RepID=B6S348_PHIRO|nr:hypothetical protein [Philodina roseola]